MPVIARMDRLLQKNIYNSCLSRRRSEEINKECKTLSSALEEVQHKGTLIQRLTVLENRVLQLSLEMDVVNTSKSSSSTVQVSGKDSEISIPKMEDRVILNTQQMQDPPMIEPQERTCADGFVKEITAQHNGKGQKKKPQKRCLWLRC